jgi:hypothetical protein
MRLPAAWLLEGWFSSGEQPALHCVVNHAEIGNYPYCSSIPSDARSACRATHSLLLPPVSTDEGRVAAHRLPPGPALRASHQCGPATPIRKPHLD